MKIVFFVENGVPTVDDFTAKSIIAKEGNKVYFSNGSIPRGFEDSCDRVVMSKEFSHIVKWCEVKGIPFSLSGETLDIEDAVIVDEEPEVEVDEETKARDEYFSLFGKRAGNMKLDNIKAAIAAATNAE